MLSSYGQREWMTVAGIGAMLGLAVTVTGPWWAVPIVIIATLACIAFFRDPPRRTPTQRHIAVAPADGRVTSVHELEHFAPFDGPALCIRIYLSLLNVHVNRLPMHGTVAAVTHTPGDHLSVLNPDAMTKNENTLLVLEHPVKQYPVGAVRQVAGLLARTIICDLEVGKTVQRGQRFGMIKLGSTVELYLPKTQGPRAAVIAGEKVKAGVTVLAHLTLRDSATAPNTGPADRPVETDAPPQTTEDDQAEGDQQPQDVQSPTPKRDTDNATP